MILDKNIIFILCILCIFILCIFILCIIYHYNIINNICNKSLDFYIYNGENIDDMTKTIMIIGGTHGNEPAGTIAIKNLIYKLNLKKIKLKQNRLILVPYVNYCALKLNKRYVNLLGDINRKYPDNTNNTNKINNINKKILELMDQSDFVLDFHEAIGYYREDAGSIGSSIIPTDTSISYDVANILYENINKTISNDNLYKKFIILTNNNNLINEDTNKYGKNIDIKKTLRYYANLINKDYILIETTGQRNIQPIHIRVEQSKIFIDCVLQYYNSFE